MTKKQVMIALVLGTVLSLSACTAAPAASSQKEAPNSQTVQTAEEEAAISMELQEAQAETTEEVRETMLQMMIGEAKVNVSWEDNDSVAALKALCKDAPLTIQMSEYGGFEQVGPIGTRLPSADVQTRTFAGDIVLYSSSQIVVFYGSNSWAYTRLGHIIDQDASGMAALLGGGDVTITISMEEAE